jgi:hypothetical protein
MHFHRLEAFTTGTVSALLSNLRVIPPLNSKQGPLGTPAKGSLGSQPDLRPIKKFRPCLMTGIAFDIIMFFVNTVWECVVVLFTIVTHNTGF